MEDSKNEILTTLPRKRKTLFNKVFIRKQNDLQSPLKKRNNQVHFQEKREKIFHNKKIHYTENEKVRNKKRRF